MGGDPLTTKAIIKTRLGIDATTWDNLLDRIILAVTTRIQKRCNRIFSEGTYEQELHDGSDLYGSGRKYIIVRNAPVTELSTIEYNAGTYANPIWMEFHEDTYTLDAEAGILSFFGQVPWGRQNIRVSYEGGFDELPADVVEVCEEVVVRIFKRRDSEGKLSESFSESSINWSEKLFSDEDVATLNNYRRGYNL